MVNWLINSLTIVLKTWIMNSEEAVLLREVENSRKAVSRAKDFPKDRWKGSKGKSESSRGKDVQR